MHRSQIEQKCWSAQDEIKADSLWKLYKTLEAIPYHEIPADMGFAQLFSIATCFIEKYDVAENQKVSKCRDFTARISRSHSQQVLVISAKPNIKRRLGDIEGQIKLLDTKAANAANSACATNFKKRSINRADTQSNEIVVVTGDADAGAEDVVWMGGPSHSLIDGSPVRIHSSYDDETLTPPWIKKCDETQSQLIGLDKILQRLDSNDLKLDTLVKKIDILISMLQPSTSSGSSSSSSASYV